MMEDRIVLSLLVDNTAGVLSRVAGMFSRRGYNIESLTVGVTADPRYSRMTVVSLGDQTVLEQIKNQLNKLEDVRDIKELRPERSGQMTVRRSARSQVFSVRPLWMWEKIP